MEAWWRSEPLSAEEASLLVAVLKAHYNSSFRSNPSSVTVAQVADSSGDLSKSIAAGIMTMGGKHAPLEQTHRFLSLEYPQHEVAGILKRGGKVPGWGGTFQKGQPDALWDEVRHTLFRVQLSMYQKLESVSIALVEHGKILHPNPSAYTAATAIVLGLPGYLAAYLFILGRLTAWAEIASEQLRKER